MPKVRSLFVDVTCKYVEAREVAPLRFRRQYVLPSTLPDCRVLQRVAAEDSEKDAFDRHFGNSSGQ